jgi:hypothetical protein
MYAKELRIGNLLENGKVIGSNDHRSVFVGNNWYLTQDLKPIELTYQWLDKLGFEFKDAGDFGHYYSLDNFDLNQDYQPIDFDCIEIKYVHQLQNLYFALTGKELEIKQ